MATYVDVLLNMRWFDLWPINDDVMCATHQQDAFDLI